MPDAGSWPDWIATGVAFFAFVVASVAAWATVQTNRAQQLSLRIQQKQITVLQEESRRGQASKVNMVIYGRSILVTNFSDLPIFEVMYSLDSTKQRYLTPRLDPGIDNALEIDLTGDNVSADQRHWILDFEDISHVNWALGLDGKLQNRTISHTAHQEALKLLEEIRDEEYKLQFVRFYDPQRYFILKRIRKLRSRLPEPDIEG